MVIQILWVHAYFLNRNGFIKKNFRSKAFISIYKTGLASLIWTLKVWNISKSESFKDWHDVINRKFHSFLMTGNSQNAGTLEIVWNHFQALCTRCIQDIINVICGLWSFPQNKNISLFICKWSKIQNHLKYFYP